MEKPAPPSPDIVRSTRPLQGYLSFEFGNKLPKGNVLTENVEVITNGNSRKNWDSIVSVVKYCFFSSWKILRSEIKSNLKTRKSAKKSYL